MNRVPCLVLCAVALASLSGLSCRSPRERISGVGKRGEPLPVSERWAVDLGETLEGRLYNTAVVSGTQVIASGPALILRFGEDGKATTIASLICTDRFMGFPTRRPRAVDGPNRDEARSAKGRRGPDPVGCRTKSAGHRPAGKPYKYSLARGGVNPARPRGHRAAPGPQRA